MAIPIRFLLASILLAFAGLAAAESARLSAGGQPIIIGGFTPGARYSLSVYGMVSYPNTPQRPFHVYRDACFEWQGPRNVPGTPVAVFQNDFGVQICGEDPRYRDGAWRTLERVEFVAPREQMVAWMAPPNLPERELEAAEWQYLRVLVRPLDRQHVGWPPHELDRCLLRWPLAQQPTSGPPVCFGFRVAWTHSHWPHRLSMSRLVEVDVDTCRLTDYAVRQGYELDPNFGGPHAGESRATAARTAVEPLGGDFYGCLGQPRVLPEPAPAPVDPFRPDPSGFGPFESATPPFDPSRFDPRPGSAGLASFDPRTLDRGVLAAYGVFHANSCPWAFDGECDEPGIGTGLCAAGTDTFDCTGVAFDWSNACPWAFDGECDEPGIGTGACLPGTDTFDCRGASFDWSNSCPWAFDGECDEPGIGTGVCLPGTDTYDCAQVFAVQPAPDPIPDLPDDTERRDFALDACDTWSVSNSGGVEGTVDVWDISGIPDGAAFDLRFNARSQPDRYRVTYRGVQVYDSGWRGASSYDGDPRYPGGIAGPGAGEELDLFVKRGVDAFTVTVVGVERGTVWDYRVRCRLP